MIRRTPAPGAALCAVVLALSACAGTDEPADEPRAAATTPAPEASAPGSARPQSSPSAGPSPSPTEEGTLIELTYAGGEVSGDTDRVEVPLGSTVVLRVTSDVAEEVHVHGVDEYVDLPAGQTTEATFVADVPGVFELELHGAGTLLTRIQVQ